MFQTLLELKENHVYILQIMKAILDQHTTMLEVSMRLPQFISTQQPRKIMNLEDASLFHLQEWTDYVDTVVRRPVFRQTAC